ncbi:protein of unknown function [Ralstonia solanacearum CMR15]|nr:protein of unknown function [Ralstonia solanacearum CMR15]
MNFSTDVNGENLFQKVSISSISHLSILMPTSRSTRNDALSMEMKIFDNSPRPCRSWGFHRPLVTLQFVCS